MRAKSWLPLATLLQFAFLPSASLAANVPNYLSGDNAARQVAKLTGEVRWYKDLNQAEKEAHRQSKPIVWIQMLGQMEGAT